MSPNNQSQNGFAELVDGWVAREMRGDCGSFYDLVRRLPGVYPNDVLTSMERLIKSGAIPDTLQIAEPHTHSISPLRLPAFYSMLPIPHPLDYDWRFSEFAVDRLLSEGLRLTSGDAPIVMLGTPSLAIAAAERNYPRDVFLLDNNQAVVQCFPSSRSSVTAIKCELLNGNLPDIVGETVIVDPPWYVPHMKAFIWVAAARCRHSGHILMSLPPIGTRPDIEVDRHKILEWASSLGLELQWLESHALPYLSPLFEVNALRHGTGRNVPLDWRRGDLALFRKTNDPDVERPTLLTAPRPSWREFVLHGVRIRLRLESDPGFKGPQLLPIVETSILPSVSQRDPRRSLVDVWTTGNRVFRCEGRSVLTTILAALEEGVDPLGATITASDRILSASEQGMVTQVVAQLNQVIDTEKLEIANYWGLLIMRGRDH